MSGNGQLPSALLLFDIDGTILRGYGGTVRAMERAARAVLAPTFSFAGIEMAGRLDPLIFAAAAEKNNLCPTEEQLATFTERYFEELAEERGANRILPGVSGLIGRLEGEAAYVLGVLTGNLGPSARIKLRSVGLDPKSFRVEAFGGDAPTRTGLVEVAMARAAAHFSAPLPARRVLIIGDTPHDVQCARENGCPCLAVGTGGYPREVLLEAGAAAVLDNLAETEAVLGIIADLVG